MADPKPTPRKNAFEEMFDRPLTRPDNDEGMGPILGEDVSVEHEGEEIARNAAHDTDRSDKA